MWFGFIKWVWVIMYNKGKVKLEELFIYEELVDFKWKGWVIICFFSNEYN